MQNLVALAIVLRFVSVDGLRKSYRYSTLSGAQKKAWEMVGRHPEVSSNFGYAVSADGVVKVTPEGVTLSDLFPSEPASEPTREDLEAAEPVGVPLPSEPAPETEPPAKPKRSKATGRGSRPGASGCSNRRSTARRAPAAPEAFPLSPEAREDLQTFPADPATIVAQSGGETNENALDNFEGTEARNLATRAAAIESAAAGLAGAPKSAALDLEDPALWTGGAVAPRFPRDPNVNPTLPVVALEPETEPASEPSVHVPFEALPSNDLLSVLAKPVPAADYVAFNKATQLEAAAKLSALDDATEAMVDSFLSRTEPAPEPLPLPGPFPGTFAVLDSKGETVGYWRDVSTDAKPMVVVFFSDDLYCGSADDVPSAVEKLRREVEKKAQETNGNAPESAPEVSPAPSSPSEPEATGEPSEALLDILARFDVKLPLDRAGKWNRHLSDERLRELHVALSGKATNRSERCGVTWRVKKLIEGKRPGASTSKPEGKTGLETRTEKAKTKAREALAAYLALVPEGFRLSAGQALVAEVLR